MNEDITRLSDAIHRIDAILGEYGDAYKARQLPMAYRGELRLIEVRSTSNYGRNPSEAALAVAREAMETAGKSEQRRGEMERDERLAALSLELERIRAALPSLLGRAVIGVGEEARALLRPEAKP